MKTLHEWFLIIKIRFILASSKTAIFFQWLFGILASLVGAIMLVPSLSDLPVIHEFVIKSNAYINIGVVIVGWVLARLNVKNRDELKNKLTELLENDK